MDFERSLTHEIAVNRSQGSIRKWILSDRINSILAIAVNPS
ncbi:hypothetical protein [Dolichospermum sp. LEGE 00246]|nr:hypothetical protein [Dolichospermum sp. LEGE 00246]